MSSDGDLNQGGNSGGVEKCSHSGCILNGEPMTDIGCGFHVESERKKNLGPLQSFYPQQHSEIVKKEPMEASEEVSGYRGRRVWFWIYWDSDANQSFKRRHPAGSWRSGKRELGTVIFVGKMSRCYRLRSPEVRQEIRKEVVELSSGPVQHLEDGQRNKE